MHNTRRGRTGRVDSLAIRVYAPNPTSISQAPVLGQLNGSLPHVLQSKISVSQAGSSFGAELLLLAGDIIRTGESGGQSRLVPVISQQRILHQPILDLLPERHAALVHVQLLLYFFLRLGTHPLLLRGELVLE